MDLVGRRVQKEFTAEIGSSKRRLFAGEVASFDQAVGWWKIVYDDGDVEELDRAGLEAILVPANVPDLLGRRVKKHFRAEDGSRELRPFEGEVVAFDEKVGWYTIKYDDGDVEELDRPGAEKILIPGFVGPPSGSESDEGVVEALVELSAPMPTLGLAFSSDAAPALAAPSETLQPSPPTQPSPRPRSASETFLDRLSTTAAFQPGRRAELGGDAFRPSQPERSQSDAFQPSQPERSQSDASLRLPPSLATFPSQKSEDEDSVSLD